MFSASLQRAPRAHRLAAPGDRRAAPSRFHFLLLCLRLAMGGFCQAPLLLMWQVGSFSSVFTKGKSSWTFWSLSNMFWSAWRCVGLVGTIPSSSLYLLPPPISFYKLGLSMTMES